MSRRVQLVLLCEDNQQEAFLRRFFVAMGWKSRDFRVTKSPSGRGSAAQFVREHFPDELTAYRRQQSRVNVALVVMQDGDTEGVEKRLTVLDAACREKGIDPRQPGERVAIFVPTWCIETWLAYLDGETVDEARKDYPRLPRERDCAPHVNVLVEMCHYKSLRDPAPRSLEMACKEYRGHLA